MPVKPEKLNSNCLSSQYDEVRQVLGEWRQKRSILDFSNLNHIGLPAKLNLIAQRLNAEVEEYRLETKETGPNSPLSVLELVDVLIFLLYAQDLVDAEAVPEAGVIINPGASGLEVHLDYLQEIAASLDQPDAQKKVKEFLQIWAAIYLQQTGSSEEWDNATLEDLVRWKILFNGLNRPPEYYQPYDLQGRPLTDEQSFLKYEHVEACLRAIRDYMADTLGRKVPLDPWMHQPFGDLILDYSNPKAYSLLLAKLSEPVVQEYSLLADLAVSKRNISTKERQAAVSGDSPVLARLLQIGGGVPVSEFDNYD